MQNAPFPKHSRRLPNMPTRTAKLVVILLTTCFCATPTAAMYRWVDENGVTVYSQTPPPAADALEIRKEPGPRTEDARAAQERVEQQRGQVFDEGEARRETAEVPATKGVEVKRRSADCEVARENLFKFQNLGRRMVHMPDGRYVRLTEEQVRTQIDKAQMQVDEFCN